MPDTGVAPCCRVKVALVTVKGPIASLNVALMLLSADTPCALVAGAVEVTVGGVVFALDPVVKFQT